MPPLPHFLFRPSRNERPFSLLPPLFASKTNTQHPHVFYRISRNVEVPPLPPLSSGVPGGLGRSLLAVNHHGVTRRTRNKTTCHSRLAFRTMIHLRKKQSTHNSIVRSFLFYLIRFGATPHWETLLSLMENDEDDDVFWSRLDSPRVLSNWRKSDPGQLVC